jgi:glycine cleavage system transcriptional repressor
VQPDVRITVFGADRAGIVAKVTGVLAEAGLDILNLESDVGGSKEQPIYIMHIEGCAAEGIEPLQSALNVVIREGIEASLTPIDTLIG